MATVCPSCTQIESCIFHSAYNDCPVTAFSSVLKFSQFVQDLACKLKPILHSCNVQSLVQYIRNWANNVGCARAKHPSYWFLLQDYCQVTHGEVPLLDTLNSLHLCARPRMLCHVTPGKMMPSSRGVSSVSSPSSFI